MDADPDLPPNLRMPSLPPPSGASDDGWFADEEVSQRSARHRPPDGFEDTRYERNRYGFVKYKVEHGVPDVGGLGWRSKQGHVLKNQSYYSVAPKSNIWNNAAHAGPETWKVYHGPRMRNDANLMEALDRLDANQIEWETKKLFCNSTRVQTLDRFYNQKVKNEQYEIQDKWAPHRRAKREVHDSFDRFEVELDSMPMKELKKVLTPAVLHGDREAMRNIGKRIQHEETWKHAWKQAELTRRQDIRSDMEHRMAYNDLLQEMAGQPYSRGPPGRQLPNNCTGRLEELARHKDEFHIDDITKLTDFRGLVHCDNQHALEARFPGQGHKQTAKFREAVTDAYSQPGWPPPPRPDSPGMKATKKRTPRGLSLKRGSIPVSTQRLQNSEKRLNDDALAQSAVSQFQKTKAPPAPEQRKTLLMDKVINDPHLMSSQLTSRSDNGGMTSGSMATQRTHGEKPPKMRSYVYPVLVSTMNHREDKIGKAHEIKRQQTRKSIAADTAAEAASLAAEAERSFEETVAAHPEEIVLAPATARASIKARTYASRKSMKEVRLARLGVSIHGARGLRAADRSGNSDPFCVVKIPGRPHSKFQTQVIRSTLRPEWRETFILEDFFICDELHFTVYDKDIFRNEVLGVASLTQADILPNGWSGDLLLYDAGPSEKVDPDSIPHECAECGNRFMPDANFCRKCGAQRIVGKMADHPEEDPPSLHKRHSAKNLEPPMLRVKIQVLENADPDGVLEAGAVRGAEDSDDGRETADPTCRDLDSFEAGLTPAPRLGNFWMTPRGDMQSTKPAEAPFSRAGASVVCKCGNTFAPDALFCRKCGTRRPEEVPRDEQPEAAADAAASAGITDGGAPDP
mmetsp:Transcript_115997/g.200588  ORF Transcript_115997/g.200588 Transcript_115997/m.200588 type:complete len:855 (+) Transcript_115997:102-2666(+)